MGKRLRAFDRVRGDLVERIVDSDTTPCLTLSRAFGARFDWVIAPGDGLDVALLRAEIAALSSTGRART